MKRTSEIIGWLVLALFALAMAPRVNAQTATLKATLADTAANVAKSNAYIRVELANCGNNTPVVKLSGDTTRKILIRAGEYRPDTTGQITASIYRNDFISCGGTTGNTYYLVSYFADNAVFRQDKIQCTQATCDLAYIAPINVNPTSPVGRVGVALSTPASSTDSCSTGQIWADANFVYVCVAPNTIKRAALSAF